VQNPTNEVAYWPNGRGIPTNALLPWYSTISHINIFVQFLTTLAPSLQVPDFLNTVAPCFQLLIDFVPAWVTFNYAFGTPGAGGTVFHLDSPHNLDFQILS
jgi:hypothetical protein